MKKKNEKKTLLKLGMKYKQQTQRKLDSKYKTMPATAQQQTG